MGEIGLVKMGKVSKIVPFSPIFLPFPINSHIFHTFPEMYFWQFLTTPHFSPFPPIFPPSSQFTPFSHPPPSFSKPLRLGG